MKERAYQQKLRAQLDEWQCRIEKLRQRVRKTGPDSRLEFEYQIQDLLAKQAAARRKLNQLQRANGTIGRGAGARVESAIKKIVSGVR